MFFKLVDFSRLEKRYVRILILVWNIKHFLFFYKSLPDNDYMKEFKKNRANVTKCLGFYLSREFTTSEKFKILKYHHLFMCANYSNEFLNSLNGKGLSIWQKETESDNHSIFISNSINKKVYGEGELVLEYKFNGLLLFTFVFTLIPSYILGKSFSDCFYIGCSQGNKNSREQWKQATKLNYRISPDDILIVALQAWSYKNDIKKIIGINSENQVSGFIYNYQNDSSLTYEKLWINNGAIQQDGFFVIPNSPQAKDKNLKNNYRSREKKQHLIRKEIFDQILENIDYHTKNS